MDLRQAWELARGLLDEHGLAGWRVELDQAKRRAGICRYDRKVIGLSAPLTRLHPVEEVRDTILHEIAHALAGPRAGHGPAWVATARRIGCTGARCVPAEAPRVPGRWVGVCPQGHVADRHRRPPRVLLCRACGTRETRERIFDWVYDGRPAPMHPNYLAELRAVQQGTRITVLPLGSRVRIVLPGSYHGRTGTVTKVGRSRYTVDLPGGAVLVPWAGVERT